MKKIFALLLIATLAFALFACTVEPVTCEHGDENYDGKCDICGETGYYERGEGQVVCKLCDVVMNVNTIGFKGGCNPIPISYEVADGNLVFALADIIAGEREFK